MFLRRLLAATLAATTLLTLAPSSGASSSFGSSRPAVDFSLQAPDTTPAPAGPVVNQGDRVRISQATSPQGITLGSMCTVGYIDHAHHRAWIASHCGDDGATVSNSYGKRIGTFRWANGNRYAGTRVLEGASRDIAYIELEPEVRAGENRYSGDTVITALDQVAVGAEGCVFGQTTRRVSCGTVSNSSGFYGFTNLSRVNGAEVTYGDSGGPVWVPGQGLLGVLSEMYSPGQPGNYIIATQPPR